MLKTHGQSARAHYWHGVYLMLREKNYGAAAAAFEFAVKLDPAYMPAYFQIGHVAALAGASFAHGEQALKNTSRRSRALITGSAALLLCAILLLAASAFGDDVIKRGAAIPPGAVRGMLDEGRARRGKSGNPRDVQEFRGSQG